MNKLIIVSILISFCSGVSFSQSEIEVYSAQVKNQSKKTDVLEKSAAQFIEDGQYFQAVNIYEELMNQNPSKKKKFIYNIRLGDLAELNGNYGASLEYYRKAENLYKKNIDVKYKKGDILLKSNLYTLAENAFLSALDIDKNSNYAKMKLGDIYFLQNLYLKALERYAAIDAYYYTPQIVNNMAKCYRSAGKIDEALKSVNDFLSSNENPQIYFLSAVLYLDKKMYGEAEKQFLTAVKLDSENFAAYVYLAGIYLNAGDLRKSKENLDKAYKLNSSYCAIDLLYAQIAYKEKKIYDARRYAYNAYMKAKSDFTKTQAKKTLDFLNGKTM